MAGKNRYDAKRDRNEREIVQELERLGFMVERSLPVDLIVVGRGKLLTVEVKMAGGRLTETEEQYIENCRALGVEVPVAYTTEDILRAMGVL